MYWAKLFVHKRYFLPEPAHTLCRNIKYFTQGKKKKREISRKVNFLLLFRASSRLNPPHPFVKAELMKTLRIKVGLDFMLIYVKNVTMES